MTTIPIHTAHKAARSRLLEVLTSPLFTNLLDERSTPSFPLRHPSTWTTVPEAWESVMQNLTPHVLGLVYAPLGSGVDETLFSGDGNTHTRTQATTWHVDIYVRKPAALPESNLLGRKMLVEEWEEDISDLYRGCIIDCLTEWGHSTDGAINEIMLSESRTTVFRSASQDLYGHAGVAFTIFQDVSIRSPRRT